MELVLLVVLPGWIKVYTDGMVKTKDIQGLCTKKAQLLLVIFARNETIRDEDLSCPPRRFPDRSSQANLPTENYSKNFKSLNADDNHHCGLFPISKQAAMASSVVGTSNKCSSCLQSKGPHQLVKCAGCLSVWYCGK